MERNGRSRHMTLWRSLKAPQPPESPRERYGPGDAVPGPSSRSAPALKPGRFKKITLDNATNSFASLMLSSQPIEVGATGYLSVSIQSPSNRNGSDIINGDPSRFTSVAFGNNGPPFPPSAAAGGL